MVGVLNDVAVFDHRQHVQFGDGVSGTFELCILVQFVPGGGEKSGVQGLAGGDVGDGHCCKKELGRGGGWDNNTTKLEKW